MGSEDLKGLEPVIFYTTQLFGPGYIVLASVNGYLFWDKWKMIPDGILPTSIFENDRFPNNHRIASVFKITSWSFLTITWKLYELHAWSTLDADWSPLAYFPNLFGVYSQFVTVAFLWEISNILEIRFDFLKKMIQNGFSTIATTQITGGHLKFKVKRIKSKYKSLYTLTLEVNRLFGRTISLLIFITIASILNNVYWGLKYGTLLNIDLLAVGLGGTLFQIIQLIFVIMACDRIECSGLDIVNACYRLQGNVFTSEVREELVYLTEYLKKLRPKFILASCICVNRYTLSSLISVITSYIIVIIQLK